LRLLDNCTVSSQRKIQHHKVIVRHSGKPYFVIQHN
jgi:uncharacterized protein YjhX (UPF0386 family)